MRGRKPIPDRLKILTGNPGRRPIREGPEPGGIPTRPDHLSDEARVEWNRVVPELLVTGPIIKARSGYPMLNPYLVVANAAMKQMTELLVEFGMSPSSRSRVAMSAEPQDELEEFLARKQG